MPALTFAARSAIAAAVVAETPSIITSFAAGGATSHSTFHRTLPALSPDASPQHPPTLARVVQQDTFSAARAMIRDGAAPARTAVLNLASDIAPGGGWTTTLCETQEEALCYSSTLYSTLRAEWYPWDNKLAAGIWSPGVAVHRDTLANACGRLPADDTVVLGVVTIAAPRCPAVTGGRKVGEFRDRATADSLREKTRAVLRMAASNGRSNLVLGAMGCGAYGCPPGAVAKIMAEVAREPEYSGWFERVWWAVVDPLGEGNAEVFREVCEGVRVGGGGPDAESAVE